MHPSAQLGLLPSITRYSYPAFFKPESTMMSAVALMISSLTAAARVQVWLRQEAIRLWYIFVSLTGAVEAVPSVVTHVGLERQSIIEGR